MASIIVFHIPTTKQVEHAATQLLHLCEASATIEGKVVVSGVALEEWDGWVGVSEAMKTDLACGFMYIHVCAGDAD